VSPTPSGVQQYLLTDTVHQLRAQIQLLATRLERLASQVAPEGLPVHARLTADVERLSGTLDELLRLGDEEHRDEPVAVNVSSVLAERVEAWTDIASARGLDLRLVPAPPTLALTRVGAAEQVIDILLDNAIKYSRLPGRITASVRRDENTVTVEVVDQGPGMSAQERAAAPARGWRGTNPIEGQGLGLSIAKRLAAASGGRLGIDSGPQGRGLNAHVEFPLVGRPAPPREAFP
jgi:signal transduction histidine kinase